MNSGAGRVGPSGARVVNCMIPHDRVRGTRPRGNVTLMGTGPTSLSGVSRMTYATSRGIDWVVVNTGAQYRPKVEEICTLRKYRHTRRTKCRRGRAGAGENILDLH